MPWCDLSSPTSPFASCGNLCRSPWTLSMPHCLSVLRQIRRNSASHTEIRPTHTSWKTGSQEPCGSYSVSPDSMSAQTTPSLTVWNQVRHIGPKTYYLVKGEPYVQLHMYACIRILPANIVHHRIIRSSVFTFWLMPAASREGAEAIFNQSALFFFSCNFLCFKYQHLEFQFQQTFSNE